MLSLIQSSGISPGCYDFSKVIERGLVVTMTSACSLRTHGCNPSGPMVLCVSSLFKGSLTSQGGQVYPQRASLPSCKFLSGLRGLGCIQIFLFWFASFWLFFLAHVCWCAFLHIPSALLCLSAQPTCFGMPFCMTELPQCAILILVPYLFLKCPNLSKNPF